MIPDLPSFLSPFKAQAKSLLDKGCLGEIQFSGPTYQIQFFDPKSKEEAWAFLHLDDQGQIQDCFCSCTDSEGLDHCAHIAASWLHIYNKHPLPLHQRFQHSLWNQLCQIYCDRLGDAPTALEKVSSGFYQHLSISGKHVFFIKALSASAKEYLTEILEHRRKETEETSLKFSNFPQEEINLWREGKPSFQLKYELSFWNDLAQWLMRLQDDGVEYSIEFGYSSKELPNSIRISFSELELGFYLSTANLPQIIPTLSTVNSPLGVFGASFENVKRIVYDKAAKELHIEAYGPSQQPSRKALTSGQILDGWIFVAKEGFYSRDQSKTLESSVKGEKLAEMLSERSSLIKQFLQGDVLHTEPIALSYSLTFDPEWNMHIVAHAFSPGDLSTPHANFLGNWIYLEEDGFYPIEETPFSNVETIIPAEEVGDFVSLERSWLNTQEGFGTHLANIEAQLAYSLSEENRLRFSRVTEVHSEEESKDFGSWIYVAGKGFYAKVTTVTNLPLRPDVSISQQQIPLFVRINQQELQLVPGFFSDRSPVASSTLHIVLDDEDAVHIEPHYEILPEYQNKEVRHFDDFVYVAGEGFSEIPPLARLPERFYHSATIEPNEVPQFLEQELPSLKSYISELDARLYKPNEVKLLASLLSKEESGYIIKLLYQTEKGSIPLAKLWKAIKQKKPLLFTEAGYLNLADKRFDWVRLIPRNKLDIRTNTLQLSTLELFRLYLLETFTIQPDSPDNESSTAALKELIEFHLPEMPNYQGLVSSLRPYQVLGVHWLWFLYRHNLSGMLCDEMGLGKTHQAMALFAAIMNYTKAPKPFLVICPTSVIYHWEEKLHEFLPDLKVCVYHGIDRSLEAPETVNVILTSYGVWRIDYALLSAFSYEVVVLDEIQIAKNHNSRIHTRLRQINSAMILGMTGTPIENQIRELKALFDIVLPGYMPTEADFRELFIKPIERAESLERKELLKRFIKPFTLRRKKADVLTDLPEKTEEIAHCDLSLEQQVLYNQMLMQSRQKILEQLHDASSPIPYMHIFALLNNLKQICNHPAAFLKTPDAYQEHQSGKWDLFVELLNEARDSQQKVVIFSQYLAMLDIFAHYLNEIGVGYATIRGSTKNRGEQVARFNHDSNCEVFLASLRAAGLGVDLTAGSVVFHYDRWWNAAREEQATDRVHRIGQTRGVQVFKFVTKRTFEERIAAIIARKGRLMEEVVTADDHQFMKIFDRQELIYLLEEVEEMKDHERE